MGKIEECISEVAITLNIDEVHVRETIRNFLLYREFKEHHDIEGDVIEDEEGSSDDDSSPDYEPSSSEEDEDGSSDEDEYSDEDDYSSEEDASEDSDDEEDKIREETVEISYKFYDEAIKALEKNKNISLNSKERKILEEFYRRQKIDYEEFNGYFSQVGHMLDLYYFTINEQFTSEEIFRMAVNSGNFILLVCSIVNNNYKLPSNYKQFIGQGGNSFVSHGGGPLVREEGMSEEDYALQIALKGIELSRKYKLPITWLHNSVETKIIDKLAARSANSKIYKVVLIGDGGVGKTSFVKRARNSLYSESVEYTPTRGVEITPVEVDGVTFDVWDCAGLEEFEGLRDGYFVGADCVIIMCDERIETVKNMVLWKEKFKYIVRTDVPIEYIFNDCNSFKVRSLRDKYIRRGDSVTNVCVRTDTNITEVFRKLITKLESSEFSK